LASTRDPEWFSSGVIVAGAATKRRHEWAWMPIQIGIGHGAFNSG
jgi:hypothetical protein